MEVCDKCHERDIDAIQCERPIEKHHPVGFFKCRICGEVRMIYICHKYQSSKEETYIENKQCGNCKFFDKCSRLATVKDDPIKAAKGCITFVYQKERHDDRSSGGCYS